MKSINFNTGIKEYAVNGDEGNVIRVNVGDMNIATRFKENINLFDDIQRDIDENGKPTPEKLSEYDKTIKEKIDYIFGSDVSSHAFGNASCLSPVGDGKLMFTAFMESFMELIKEDAEQFRRENGAPSTVARYLPPEMKGVEAPKVKKNDFDLSKLTPEQLAYLASLNKKE